MFTLCFSRYSSGVSLGLGTGSESTGASLGDPFASLEFTSPPVLTSVLIFEAGSSCITSPFVPETIIFVGDSSAITNNYFETQYHLHKYGLYKICAY